MATLSLEDVDLRYLQSGNGPDIVWIPGGDEVADAWDHQFADFGRSFRNTSFDPRGAGQTVCLQRPPWTIADFAADCAALIRATCEPPVVLIGLSMGSLITLQMAIDYPELVRLAIPMGTAAVATGFSRDWMIAEVKYRRAGGTLPPDFAVTHYAAFSYPSEVLGNDELWEKIKQRVGGNYGERDGEMLIAQWQACIDFDVVDRLPGMPGADSRHRVLRGLPVSGAHGSTGGGARWQRTLPPVAGLGSRVLRGAQAGSREQ